MAMTVSFSFNALFASPIAGFAPLQFTPIDQFQIDLARFGNGNLFWSYQYGTTTLPTIQAQVYSPGGERIQGVQLPGEFGPSPGRGTSQHSATLINGNVVSVWLPAEAPDDVRFQITNASGGVVLADTGLPFIGGTRSQPSVAGLTGGGFVVTWGRTDGGDAKLYAKLYDSGGNPVGITNDFITIDDVGGATAANARVVGLTGGGFAVVYERTGTDGRPDIAFQIFNGSGGQTVAETIVDGFGWRQGEIELAARTDGGFTIVYSDSGWTGTGSGDPTNVSVVSYSATGASTTGINGIGLLAINDAEPDIALLSSGHGVVARTAVGSDRDIVLSLLNTDGSLLTDTMLTIGGTGNQRGGSLVAMGDGRFALAWVDEPTFRTYLQTYALVNNAQGDGANDVYTGLNTLSNNINGRGGNDSILGGVLNDTLFGSDGDDTLRGGGGDDIISGDFGFDSLDGEGGYDTIDTRFWTSSGIDTLNLNTGVWAGSWGSEIVANFEAAFTGGTRDSIIGTGIGNLIDAGAGDDTVLGGLGDDTIRPGAGADNVDGEGGFDWLDLRAENLTGHTVNLALGGMVNGATIETVNGFEAILDGNGAGYLVGANVASRIEGGGGNDILIGAGGVVDTLLGGDGDDYIEGGGGPDSMVGGDFGFDTYDMSFWNGGGVYRLTEGYWAFTGTPTTPFDTIIGFEAVIDGNGASSIIGAGAANRLDARGGNDTVLGDLGDDTLLGGSGDDSLLGGNQNDSLIGDADNDTLLGEDGNDVLIGGEGRDSMDGGAGNDTVSFVHEIFGFRTIRLTQGDVRDSGGNLMETITGFEAVWDNDSDNRLEGRANSTLEGRGGDDTLVGFANNSQLSGGDGNDIIDMLFGWSSTIDGGAGRDTLDMGISAGGATILNVINLETGVMLANGGANGQVLNVEAVFDNIGASSITGTTGDNRLEGRGGNDTLRGGLGADTLLGGDGNDLLDGGAGIESMDGGIGFDTLDYSADTMSGHTVNLSTGTFVDAVGTDTILNFEAYIDSSGNGRIFGRQDMGSRIEGRGGNDTINGGGLSPTELFNDTILGGDGDDSIFATYGFDSIDGGAGNDSYVGLLWDFSIVYDLIAGTLSNGVDTITIANFENLIDGSGSSFIAGTDGANLLDGRGGNDTLFGRGGDDVLIGGAGADSFDGGTHTFADTVSYETSTAAVTVYVTAPASSTGDATGDTYTGIEAWNLTRATAGDTFFGGAAGEQVYGLDGADVLFGNGGNDQLYGGNGDDFILPGADMDEVNGVGGFDAVFYGDSAGAISLNLATGVHSGFAQGDTFVSIEAFLMTEQGDTVVGADNAGAGDIIYGLGGNDSLTGQGGFDYLLGGDGADTLNGGFGYDLMTGGAGADRFVFNNGFEGGAFAGGGEVITDFQAGTDRLAFVGATSGFASFSVGNNLFIQNGGPTGTQGTTTGPTLIYDRTAGALWFDSNGSQAGGLNYLVSLLGTPTLTAADFMVI